jgi:hypothetical protein
LQRGAAAGELRPADLLRFAQDQARRGDVRFKMVLDQVNQAARGFEDEPAAREQLLAAITDLDSPDKTPIQVMRESVERVRAGGLASKQPRAAATAGTAADGTGGVTKDANGMWVAAPGQRLTQDMSISNLERGRGNTEKADEIDRRVTERAAGGGKGASPVDKFYAAKVESEVALGLIDRTRKILTASPEVVGFAGTFGLFVNGVADQARSLMNKPVTLGGGGGSPMVVDSRVLQDDFSAKVIWSRVTSDPDLKTGFGWVDKAPEAQALRTNLLLLAFSVARSIEPGGRLSNQDVANVLRALGQGGRDIFTSPKAMASALNEVENYVKTTLNSRYRSVVDQSPEFAKANPREPYPMGAPQPAAAPAGAPTAAPPRTGNAAQGAQRFLSPSAGAIEFLRRNPQLKGDFDKKFGPGAAARALGN